MMENNTLKFMDAVKKMIYTILKKENILQGQWHIGKVDEVLSNKLLSVYVDGSDVSQKIPYNPDITFNEGDFVFILYVNNNPRDKFVAFKRAI